MKIALTGGIACGKSRLSEILTELGCSVLDADDVVHSLEAPGGEAVPAILARFPSAASSDAASSQSVNRPALAEIVFSDPSARADLEAILFPLVRERLNAFAASPTTNHQSPTTKIKICIIPLLFESHWEKDYDIILTISSPAEKQIDRMVSTRNYTREHAEARLAAQMPVSEKASRSHYVINNDSTPEKLRTEACRLVAWLKERMKYEH